MLGIVYSHILYENYVFSLCFAGIHIEVRRLNPSLHSQKRAYNRFFSEAMDVRSKLAIELETRR